MFPNIDNNLDISAVKRALNSRYVNIPSTDCLVEAVEICLRVNNCQFSGQSFVQKHGAAMGPKTPAVMQIWPWASSMRKPNLEVAWNLCFGGDTGMIFLTFGLSVYRNYWNLLIILTICIQLSNLNWFTLTVIWMSLISRCIFVTVLLALMFMLNPLIATSTYLFRVHTPYVAKEQSPLLFCSTDDFLQKRCKEYKGYMKSQNYQAELVDKQFDKALSIPRAERLRKKVKLAKKVFP